MDLSQLDKKYILDNTVYNCPFCKRNNVAFSFISNFKFDWNKKKVCHGYLIRCDSCRNQSLHLSWKELRKKDKRYQDDKHFYDELVDSICDEDFFYSRPSSSFVVDSNIPELIRELIFEAEECRQANFLVGGSACLRKSIYELINQEGSIVTQENGMTNYKESIKRLKEKFSAVDAELFDALSSVQELTSDNLHEDSWSFWDSKKLKFLIELVKTVLDEIYVLPVIKRSRLKELNEMKSDYSKPNK